MKRFFLVLFWTFFTNTSVFADDLFADGPMNFIEAPDGTFQPLGGYHIAVTLKSVLYFESLRPDSSQPLIIAVQLALAARKGGEIPLPHLRAVRSPLGKRLAPFLERHERTSMRYMLEYCFDSLLEKIELMEDYEVYNKEPP